MRRSRLFLCLFALGLPALACSSSTTGAPSASGPVVEASDAGADAASVAVAEDPTRFTNAGKLSQARFGHTATLLLDGRVVVLGGETTGASVLAIEVFDAATGKWQTLGDLPGKRENHTTTLLDDGRLLVVGGGASSDIGAPAGKDVLGTTLLVDPTSGSVTEGPTLHVARSHHTATRVAGGRVVVVGGSSDTHAVQPDFGDALASVEIFDPTTSRWSEAPPLTERRFLHTTSVVGSGRLVVAGGSDETERELPAVETFDPASGSWASGPELAVSRVFHAAAELDDGSVFVTTGKLTNTRFLDDSEILDARGGAWAAGPALEISRTAPSLTKLASGRLLLTGGLHGSPAGFEALGDAHIYDPSTKKWTEIGAMKSKRIMHTSTRLADGRVLVCGGTGESGEALATCELAVP